jgi:hypothetical protein
MCFGNKDDRCTEKISGVVGKRETLSTGFVVGALLGKDFCPYT